MYKVLADIHLLRREVSLDVGGEHPTETEEEEGRFRKHISISSVSTAIYNHHRGILMNDD